MRDLLAHREIMLFLNSVLRTLFHFTQLTAGYHLIFYYSLWNILSSMAAVRLRKAFRYPEDSDAEYDRDELDEEGLVARLS